MRNVIYIDRQLLIDFCDNDWLLVNKINLFKKKNFIFPCSPAHGEELVHCMHVRGASEAARQVSYLKLLSDNISIVVDWDGHVFLSSSNNDSDLKKFGSVANCFRRVVHDNGNRDTAFVISEQAERIRSIKGEETSTCAYYEVKNIIKKCTTEEALSNDNVIELLKEYSNKSFGVNVLKIKSSPLFLDREACIEILFEFLNICEFRKEHNEARAGNRVHDVSHCIYASYAYAFVTNDKKLRDNAKAVYKFMGVDTLVLSKQDFIDSHLKL